MMNRTLLLLAALLFAGAAAGQNREAGAASGQNCDTEAAAEPRIPAVSATGSAARTDEASADGAASGKANSAGIGAEQKPGSQSARNHAEGNPAQAAEQSAAVDTLPAWFYCEIAAHHLPLHRQNGVVFDFGQRTGAWSYNYLTDKDGNRLLFASGIEALNYMIRQGWEFVQAYASGKEGDISHYLLRIAPERLPEKQRAALLAPPERETPKKKTEK